MSQRKPVIEHCQFYRILTTVRHAGPFIWVDLSKHLSSPTVEAERELAWKMIDNKVWIATGEAYRSERPGWFRITFAVDEAELELGIQRSVNVVVLGRMTLLTFFP